MGASVAVVVVWLLANAHCHVPGAAGGSEGAASTRTVQPHSPDSMRVRTPLGCAAGAGRREEGGGAGGAAGLPDRHGLQQPLDLGCPLRQAWKLTLPTLSPTHPFLPSFPAPPPPQCIHTLTQLLLPSVHVGLGGVVMEEVRAVVLGWLVSGCHKVATAVTKWD